MVKKIIIGLGIKCNFPIKQNNWKLTSDTRVKSECTEGKIIIIILVFTNKGDQTNYKDAFKELPRGKKCHQNRSV